MLPNFSVSSFFKFYIHNNNHFSLSKKEQCEAKIFTVALGILSAGLINLFAYVFFYSRNFWQYRSTSLHNLIDPKIKTVLHNSGIQSAHTLPNTVSSQPPVTTAVASKVVPPPPQMHLLFDPQLVKDCEHVSLEDALYEHNKAIIEASPNFQDCFRKNYVDNTFWHLREENQKTCEEILSQPPLTLEEILNVKFDQLKEALTQGREQFEACCNEPTFKPFGTTVDFPWSGFFNMVPETSPMFDEPLNNFSLSKTAGLTPLSNALSLESGESIFFASHINNCIKQMVNRLNLDERYQHPEVKALLEDVSLNELLPPIERSALRSCILLNDELTEIRLDQLGMASKLDFVTLVQRFSNFKCPPFSAPTPTEIDNINATNFSQARVVAIQQITKKNQILDILPNLPPKFSFLLNFNFPEFEIPDLITHFDKIFVNNKGPQLKRFAFARMKLLTTDQIYALIDKFALTELHYFKKDQILKLELSKLTQDQRERLEVLL